MTCSLNCKRFAIATIAGFIFTFIYDFIVHGNLMMPLYEATADLWRPEEDTQELMPFYMIASFIMVMVLLFIFTRHYEGKGIAEGVRYGAMIGAFVGLIQASLYIYLPIPMTLAAAWFACSFIWLISLGAIFSLLYRN